MTDYGAIGTAVAVGFIAVMQVYQSHKAKQMAKTLDTVHTLTNSSMGLQKKALMEVTAAKAAITRSKQDEEAAGVAMADYSAHMEQQAKVQ